MNFIFKAFSETGGDPSSMRLIVGMTTAVIMAGWLHTTITTGEMAPLPLDGAGGILLGALGFKAWQKGKENGHLTDPKPTTP